MFFLKFIIFFSIYRSAFSVTNKDNENPAEVADHYGYQDLSSTFTEKTDYERDATEFYQALASEMTYGRSKYSSAIVRNF